jgi:hypothetical protein
MPVLVWDKVGDKRFEDGLDKGVLYLPNGSAVPWNGLTAVTEHLSSSTETVYYDGQKINEFVSLGEFTASMKALTYPKEFAIIEGAANLKQGIYVNEQKPQRFGLCYRTRLGDDQRLEHGYKIHLIYNVLAIPSNKSYTTLGAEITPVEFEWTISTIPEEVPGLRPTAHITINSREVDPWLLQEIESILYGDSHSDASLISMEDLVSYVTEWYRVRIIDHGDGTWEAVAERSGYINIESDLYFEIANINARYLDDVTFIISDTTDIEDAPEILISDLGNGIWNASTSDAGLIFTDPDDGSFTILNANAIPVVPDAYELSNTEIPRD